MPAFRARKKVRPPTLPENQMAEALKQWNPGAPTLKLQLTFRSPLESFNLSGIIALHVDDMACGGTQRFQEKVLERM